jgi:hypothetical protein
MTNFFLSVVLVARDQSLKRVRVKADPRWTLAQLEREALAFLSQQKVIADTALPFVFLQSEAGEYMLCKEDLVGDWFVTGDAFRFAPPPGQGLSLFVSAGQYSLELPQQPISSPVRPDPPTYSSGKKAHMTLSNVQARAKAKRQGGASLAHLLNGSETEPAAKKTPPPRGCEQRRRYPLPPAAGAYQVQVKRCKHCGKARAPTDRFRKERGVGVLLCPECFAKTKEA